MPFRITQLPSEDKLCRTLSWPILEQFYPSPRIEQLIETYCGQTTRVRKLTLALAGRGRARSAAHPCRLDLSAQTAWGTPPARPRGALVRAVGYRRHAGGLRLWLALDGHGWHPGRCQRYSRQCPVLWAHLRREDEQSLPTTALPVPGGSRHPC